MMKKKSKLYESVLFKSEYFDIPKKIERTVGQYIREKNTPAQYGTSGNPKHVGFVIYLNIR